MEEFSTTYCWISVSYEQRIGVLIGLVAAAWSLLDGFREIRLGAGYTHFDVWVRRVYFVAFAGLAAAGSDLWKTADLAAHGGGGISVTAAGAADSIWALKVCLTSAAIVASVSLFAAWFGGRRGCGTKRAMYLRRPMTYVIGLALLGSLAAASCIFVSGSITGFASTTAIAGGSRIAGVTAIGCLVIAVFLIVQALRARSKRGKVAPSGAVENTLFMKMMALHLAALILLAFFVHNKILEYETMALTGVP